MGAPATEQPLFFIDRDGAHEEEAEEDSVDSDDDLANKEKSGALADGANTENGEIGDEEAERQEDAEDEENNSGEQLIGEKSESASVPGTKRRAVWEDADDEVGMVNLLKVSRTKKLRKSLQEREVSGAEYADRIRDYYASSGAEVAAGPGGWAELPSARRRKEFEPKRNDESGGESEDDEDDVGFSENVKSLLQTSAKILNSRERAIGREVADRELGSLKGGILNIHRVTNANDEDPNQAEARCVQFHESGRLLLTAGLDKTLRIFQVDGERNAKVQGIRVKGFPIRSAKFTGSGQQVVMTGRHRYFYQFDMDSGVVSTVRTLVQHGERSWENFEVSGDGSRLAFIGQQGKIVILSNKTKQELGQIRLNGRVVAVAFAPRGDRGHLLYAVSEHGTVYLCDTKRMICVDRHKDEGAIHSTCIAASSSHYALGSDSGVVNVYPSSALGSPKLGTLLGLRTEKPKKTFLNLTTSIDNMAFNHDGQLLAFSSHDKKGSIRIAHIPSMSVYPNWPSSTTNIRRVCSITFSPGGGYLAVGNDKGDVQMMRLSAYPAN